MKNLHAKSPCCQEKIYHFGNRRRQCSKCKRTWRIRKKRRGRKQKRESKDYVLKYLRRQTLSIYTLARLRNVSEDKLQKRLQKSLNLFLKNQSWPVIPEGKPLIAVADAMVQFINHQIYTCYFILLRKIKDKKAIITPPLIRKGQEVWQGWEEAFKRIPQKIKTNILALVCDGHSGLISQAKRNHWLIQRCHFHLIARLQAYCSKWSFSRHRAMGKRIYQLVANILANPNEKEIFQALSSLKIYFKKSYSRDLKKILRGFIKHYKDYRTYLYYPELCLPKTNNSVESLISAIRSLNYRARGFCTLASFEKWIGAILKDKQQITCNGNFQPN